MQHLFTIIREFWYERVLRRTLQTGATARPQRYSNLAAAWLTPEPLDTLVLRSLWEADLAAVEALEQQCYDGFLAWTLADFRTDYRYNQAAVYWGLVDDRGQLVGVISGRFTYKAAHISHLFIHPAYRRHGYAQALVTRWCQVAQATGSQRVTLEVRSTNQVAQALYQGLGFAIERVVPNYYHTLKEDAFFMVYTFNN